MDGDNQNLSLGEAASRFLADLPSEERGASQKEIYKFIRWFGWERKISELTAAEVDNYAERLSMSDTDYVRKLGLTRAFLACAKKKGWSKTNLAIHLKARKGKARVKITSRQIVPDAVSLSAQGYAEMEAELSTLKSKSFELIDEIRLAAADKDFRENAPLQAAREQRGRLEGRIRELEETLKSAVIIDEQEKVALKVNVGDSVVLRDLDSGKDLCYRMVSPSEVDPAQGKISSASPIGKAVVGKEAGEIVEITVPAGKLRYRIEQVEQ